MDRRFQSQQSEWQHSVLEISRVSHMTVGGRKFKLRALVIAGNGKGKVGIGVSQGKDSQQAIGKAELAAARNSILVPVIGGTIPHEVIGKSSASTVLLRPAQRGHGLVAGGTVRAILLLAGIEDATAKNLGRTKNKLTTAFATLRALQALRQRPSNDDSRKRIVVV